MTTLEKAGRRIYFKDAPYEARQILKDAGAKWDPDRRGWWIGSTKSALAEQLAAQLNSSSSSSSSSSRNGSEQVSVSARVIQGRATYEGKNYYVLYNGFKKDGSGRCTKLCFRDGSKVFWAKNPGAVQIVKTYREPTSIESLRAYAEQRKAENAGEAECPLCARYCTCGTGKFCQHHHDGCERCGEER